jgi:hypothetical protein
LDLSRRVRSALRNWHLAHGRDGARAFLEAGPEELLECVDVVGFDDVEISLRPGTFGLYSELEPPSSRGAGLWRVHLRDVKEHRKFLDFDGGRITYERSTEDEDGGT